MKKAVVAIAVVLATLAAAPAAFGHATLQQSTPGNNSIARQSPREVTLQFSEAVETAFGSIRVYDCGGTRVDSGKIVRPSDSSVAVTLDRRLPAGTYTVTWRVISADAHPVAGAFTFHVKSASAGGECAQVFGEGTPSSIDALFKFARALDFALILLVVGGAAALALVLRSAAFELRARLYRILAGLALGLVVAGVLCIVLQGAVAGGFGLSEAFRWDTVDSVLQTRFGKAFLWQLGLAVVIAPAAFLASRSRNASLGWLVLAPALLLLPTLAAAGHARTSGTIALVADVVHVAAASVWVGGLAFTVLALLLAGADRWPLAARAVPVFSILAVGSVVTLIVAGTFRGYQEVRAFPRALGHHLRRAPAGEDRRRPTDPGPRGVQQPLRSPEAEAADRLSDRAAQVPADGRRGARAHGRDRQHHRSPRDGATGEGLRQAAEVRHRHRPDREPRGELHRRAREDGTERHPSLLLHTAGCPGQRRRRQALGNAPQPRASGPFASRCRGSCPATTRRRPECSPSPASGRS